MTIMDIEARIVRASPLHTRTAEANIRNAWAQWNGFTVPAECAGAAAERRALTTGAGLFDLSPLAKLRVTGKDAADFAARLCTVDATQMADGSARFVLWCDGDGFVRGEGRLLRLRAREFLLLSALGDAAWWQDAAAGFDVALEDISVGVAVCGLQGPHAAEVLAAAGLNFDLPPGAVRSISWRGVDLYFARSCAYHSQRYEMLATADDAILVWDRLLRSGAGATATPVGTRALDAVRVGAFYPAIGADYLPAQAANGEGRLPSALGFDRFVEPDRAHFNGRRALIARTAPRETLVRVAMDTNETQPGGELLADGARVGYLTSVANDPVLPKSVGLAWLATGAAPTTVRFHDSRGLRPRSFEATLRIL